jgi:hypothetical protein
MLICEVKHLAIKTCIKSCSTEVDIYTYMPCCHKDPLQNDQDTVQIIVSHILCFIIILWARSSV